MPPKRMVRPALESEEDVASESSSGGDGVARTATAAPATQQRRTLRAEALQRLQDARTQAQGRSRRQAAGARRTVIVSDNDGSGSERLGASTEGEADSAAAAATAGELKWGKSSQLQEPRRRPQQRYQGGRANSLVTGFRDYNADEDASDSHDNLESFIASEDDAAAEEEDAAHSRREQGAQGTSTEASPEPEAASERGGSAAEGAGGSAGGEAVSQPSLQRGSGHGGGGTDDEEPHSSQRKRRRAAAIVVIESSSSEDDGLPSADVAAPPRRRLQRISRAENRPAAADRQLQGAADVEEEAKGRAALPEADPSAADAAAGGTGARQKRNAVLASEARMRLTAAERILLAQQRFQREDPDAAAARLGAAGGDQDEAEDVHILTDEGEPSSTASDGGGPGWELAAGMEGQQEATAGGNRRQAAEGAVRMADRSPGWQRAAEELGIGQLSPKEQFSVWVEWLLLCYVDPAYSDTVAASARHSRHYSRAVRQCEWALSQKRDAAASAAWRSSAAGLLSAVESLPSCESGWSRDGPTAKYGQLDCAPCDACNRRRSHATRLLVLKGRPAAAAGGAGAGEPTDGDGRRLSSSFQETSPVYRRRQQEAAALAGNASQGGSQGNAWREERELRGAGPAAAAEGGTPGGGAEGPEDGQYQRVEFRVGRYCAARLLLYHGLFHWKRRLMARLKRELKAELRRRQRRGASVEAGEVADVILSRDSLLSSLYDSYKAVLDLAERYQLSGGEGGGGVRSWRGEFGSMHQEVTQALADLHDASDGEEGSVVWPCRRDEDGEESEEEGTSGSGGGGGALPGAAERWSAPERDGQQADIRSFLKATRKRQGCSLPGDP